MDQSGPPPEGVAEEPVEEPTPPPSISDDAGGSAAPPPSSPPPTPSGPTETVGLGDSAKLFSPNALLGSIQEQFLGSKTQEQLQHEQQEAARSQQAAALNRQAFESHQAQQKAETQKRVQETVQLKSDALRLGKYESGSAVLSQTTSGDLSEQTVVHSAIQAAQQRREREQRARQLMAQQKAVRKGPQAEGAETKSSMMDQMGGAAEAPGQSQDQDALQRQAEQAMGE